jgi:hypothetical protein
MPLDAGGLDFLKALPFSWFIFRRVRAGLVQALREESEGMVDMHTLCQVFDPSINTTPRRGRMDRLPPRLTSQGVFMAQNLYGSVWHFQPEGLEFLKLYGYLGVRLGSARHKKNLMLYSVVIHLPISPVVVQVDQPRPATVHPRSSSGKWG